MSWTLAQDRFELALHTLSVANRDLAATFTASFAAKRGGSNVIDLTGNFSRADGRAVYGYVPWLPAPVVEYLKASIKGGKSNDVRLRLKVDLAKFPFADAGSGIFSVVAKVTDADLRYADGWPQASGISGDLIFEGKGMRVAASKASVLGVQASSVRPSIPDLVQDAHLEVEGRAEDQTSDFLRFIAQSPVTKALDGVTDSMSAAGKGRLALQLDIPIRNPETFKLAGEHLLVDNQDIVDPVLPPLSHMNVRV